MTASPCPWCGAPDGRGTCPLSITCPTCQRPPGRACRRGSGHDCDTHVSRYRTTERADAEACPGWAPRRDHPQGCAHCSGLRADHPEPRLFA